MRNKIISLVLTIAIMLQFGGSTKQTKKETACSESYIEIQDPSFDMTGSKVDLAEYIKAINSIDVEYNFEQSKFQSYITMNSIADSKTKQCKFQYDDDYNYFDVYLQILENSNMNLYYQNLTEVEKQVQNALLNAFTSIYYKKDQESINDDYCTLKNIKIKIDTIEEPKIAGMCNYPEKTIIIDYEEIKNSYNTWPEFAKKELLFEEYLTKVVRHEINHFRQHTCDCREDNWYWITYDGRYVDSFREASPESEVYNFEVNEVCNPELSKWIYTYDNERQSQALLLTMGMFKDGFTMDKYYDAMFSCDFDAFHKLFHLQSVSDYGTFYNVYYALTTIDGKSELADKLRADGIDTKDELKEAVGNDYKIDIYKIVIEDLIKKINKENLSLEDSLKLYSLIKLVILKDEHQYYLMTSAEKINDQSYVNQFGTYLYYYDEDFLNGIGKIDEIYYQFISDYYKITKSSIAELLESHELTMELIKLVKYYDTGSTDIKSFAFINKYPLVGELIFCNDFSWISNDKAFNESYKRKLTIEKLQNN